ncbi:MAG: AhpC/TSA family protein [Bacteroidetes bacterium]|nr:AhpC/TSA family protein [Bacteroidota bacterium]
MIQAAYTLLAFAFVLFSCAPNDVAEETKAENPDSNAYHISGIIENHPEGAPVFLSVFNPITQEKTALDTAEIASDGSYSLAFEFTEPDLFQVNFFRKQSVMLAIDEGQNDIKLNVSGTRNGTVEISGSEDSQKLLAYDNFRAESFNRLVRPANDVMRAATQVGHEQGKIDAVVDYSKKSEIHRRELIDFTQENIGTSIALYGTALRWTGDDQTEKLDQLVSAFANVHPDLKMTQVMREKVDRYKKTAIGAKAPEIELPNPEGELTSLYDNLGTYTLIDFWASWCGPCLLQIPDLKAAEMAFAEKGFKIFGVSADSKEDRWISAIEEYKLPWPNVSDLKGWGSEAANAYNVTFLPNNFLLDSEGKIVAKNLHSAELNGLLEELLK